MLIGLSSLYLSYLRRPFGEVVDDMRRVRQDSHKPDIWEVVDVLEHSLTNDKVKILMELYHLGYRFTVHCPYEDMNIASLDREKRRQTIRRMKTSIDASAKIEASGWVLHPGLQSMDDEHMKAARTLNDEALITLYDYANSAGITPALENMALGGPYYMTTPREFEEFFDSTGVHFKIVFDAGHAHIGGLVKEFISRLTDQFHTVHAHDNDGGGDDHLSLGSGSVDWNYITSELACRNFQGIYIVEAVDQPFESLATLREMVLGAKARI